MDVLAQGFVRCRGECAAHNISAGKDLIDLGCLQLAQIFPHLLELREDIVLLRLCLCLGHLLLQLVHRFAQGLRGACIVSCIVDLSIETEVLNALKHARGVSNSNDAKSRLSSRQSLNDVVYSDV